MIRFLYRSIYGSLLLINKKMSLEKKEQ